MIRTSTIFYGHKNVIVLWWLYQHNTLCLECWCKTKFHKYIAVTIAWSTKQWLNVYSVYMQNNPCAYNPGIRKHNMFKGTSSKRFFHIYIQIQCSVFGFSKCIFKFQMLVSKMKIHTKQYENSLRLVFGWVFLKWISIVCLYCSKPQNFNARTLHFECSPFYY